jgi:hypothetical protein
MFCFCLQLHLSNWMTIRLLIFKICTPSHFVELACVFVHEFANPFLFFFFFSSNVYIFSCFLYCLVQSMRELDTRKGVLLVPVSNIMKFEHLEKS